MPRIKAPGKCLYIKYMIYIINHLMRVLMKFPRSQFIKLAQAANSAHWLNEGWSSFRFVRPESDLSRHSQTSFVRMAELTIRPL
jgi:hypothetical protein